MLKIKKITFLFSFFVSLMSFGQELKKEQLGNEWVLLTEKNGIKIYTLFENVDITGAPKSFDFVFLKFENTTSQSKTVDMQLTIHYDGHCTGCNTDNQETFRYFTIPANTTVFGDNTFEQESMNYLIKNYNGTDDYVFEAISINHLTVK